MSADRIENLIAINKLERIEGNPSTSADDWLKQAAEGLPAVKLLLDATFYRQAYSTAYDVYRQAAEALLLADGLRVVAKQGAHEVTASAAHALDGDREDSPFTNGIALGFRNTRHGAQYADSSAPDAITETVARWAYDIASKAVERVRSAISS